MIGKLTQILAIFSKNWPKNSQKMKISRPFSLSKMTLSGIIPTKNSKSPGKSGVDFEPEARQAKIPLKTHMR